MKGSHLSQVNVNLFNQKPHDLYNEFTMSLYDKKEEIPSIIWPTS